MFGRATIRLGIGPHSSYYLFNVNYIIVNKIYSLLSVTVDVPVGLSVFMFLVHGQVIIIFVVSVCLYGYGFFSGGKKIGAYCCLTIFFRLSVDAFVARI